MIKLEVPVDELNLQKMKEIKEQILDRIEKIEIKAKARRINPQHLDRILEAMRYTRSGYAVADGGKVHTSNRTAKTSIAKICWCTWKKSKIIQVYVAREPAWAPDPREADYKVETGKDGRAVAYHAVFPDRAEKVRQIKLLRCLRKYPFQVEIPDPGLVENVVTENHPLKSIVLAGKKGKYYLCTPAGYFELPNFTLPCNDNDFVKIYESLLYEYGIKVDSRKIKKWEDVERYILFILLGK